MNSTNGNYYSGAFIRVFTPKDFDHNPEVRDLLNVSGISLTICSSYFHFSLDDTLQWLRRKANPLY